MNNEIKKYCEHCKLYSSLGCQSTLICKDGNKFLTADVRFVISGDNCIVCGRDVRKDDVFYDVNGGTICESCMNTKCKCKNGRRCGMNIKPMNISEEEKARIFEESLKNQTPYIEKEPVKIRPANEWINVNDRLPENCIEVLVYDTDCGIVIGWYDKEIGDFAADFISPLDAVTHWQPLPEKPQD